uniref:Chorismate lyase n=1 Tax=Caloglossa monosticha TaxID=76906 RepID=A0A1Z1M4M8_9FLOR|nr:hypothetical protein [Caloglossa monosticha]ARW60989.1 hypothetical protein [Caloglossa monosticha]
MLIYFYQFHSIFRMPIYKQTYFNNKLNSLIPVKWQFLLLNEGSFTKILNFINAKQVILKKFQTNNCTLKNNRYLRYIWIENCLYTKMIFARSLWQLRYKNDNKLKKQLINHMPIGTSIIKFENDVYKQIHEIYYGYCIQLENKIHYNQPIWGRKYTLHYNHELFVTIQEFFSPYITEFFNN